jgi:wyosine [tRNA(Phe)-imidazoG37] synthetase (radical SAM superfamily)
MNYKFLFGPVPSRRLGLSLGVDLIPQKICSLNCVYCECGRTTDLSMERKEFRPVEEIINELDDLLKEKPDIDYITFSGSGEPTLYKGIGKVVDFIKSNYPKYSVALLTNSTLLGDKDVQEEIKDVDVILPSLDAVSDEIFNKINRPCTEIKSQDVINGLVSFSSKFKGKIWIEIFIIQGINDEPEELILFKDVLSKIRFDKIQLNSLDRPGTEQSIKKAELKRLLEIREFFKPLDSEIISKYDNESKNIFSTGDFENKILATIQRRPSTIEDLMAILKLNAHDTEELLVKLRKKGKLEAAKLDRGIFYKIKEKRNK